MKKCYKWDFFSAFQCSTGGAVRGQIESSIFCYWSFYDFIDLIILCQISRVCVKYLETSLSARNACLLLSQSRLFEEPELMQRCWDVIDAQVQDYFAARGANTNIHLHNTAWILNTSALKKMNIKDASSLVNYIQELQFFQSAPREKK